MTRSPAPSTVEPGAPHRTAALLLAALAILGLASACTADRPTTVVPSASPSDPGVAADDLIEPGVARPGAGNITDIDWKSVDPAQAYLVGPHFTAALAREATVRELTSSQLGELGVYVIDLPNGSALRASPGHELLIVEGASTVLPIQVTNGTVDLATLVVNGKASRDLHGVALLQQSTFLVANVPMGSTVLLAVTDAGRTQTLNLRTGEVGGLIPLLHPPLSGGVALRDIVHVSSPAGVTPAGKGAYSELRIEADLHAWDADRGWAAPGHGWLQVQASADVIGEFQIQLDLAHSLTLRTAAGQALPFTGALTSQFLSAGGGQSVTQVFDVPDGTRALAASFVTRGTLSVNGKTGTWQRYADPDSSGKIDLVPPRS